MRRGLWFSLLAGIPLALSAALPAPAAMAAWAPPPVKVMLDGKPLSLSPAPTIVDSRTLVPLRGVFEALGAKVTWDAQNRAAIVERNGQYVRVAIDHRLACLNQACTRATTADVPARLIDSRTFVPVRLITEALGLNVTWDNAQRAVVINTALPPAPATPPISMPTLTQGQVITGPVTLQAAGMTGARVLFYLIDPATGLGSIVAAGTDTQASYTYTPDPTVTGDRLLVAAILDATGKPVFSNPVSIRLAPQPAVTVTGVGNGGAVTGPISIGSNANFVASRVTLKLVGTDGSEETLGAVGPNDSLTWYPQIGQNGSKSILAVATDRSGNTYRSQPVPVQVQSDYRQTLSGIANGDVLSGPVTFQVSTNYTADAIRYMIDGMVIGWGYSHTYDFGPEANGQHTLQVDVTAADGTVHHFDPVTFTDQFQPKAWLTGVGPDQVVTGPVTLKAAGNVPLATAAYFLTDGLGNKVPLGTATAGTAVAWTPTGAQASTCLPDAVAPGAKSCSVAAVVKAADGSTLNTNPINFRVFLGKQYDKSVAAIPKGLSDVAFQQLLRTVTPGLWASGGLTGLTAPQTDADAKTVFQQVISRLAAQTYQRTGMSAALQVAQAILETGWGQSMPVDRYNGTVSYNLFGIKGDGPNGHVTSPTWEVYSGITYYVDGQFRAYPTIEASWSDHADFLFVRPWYAPFRAVMSDPVLGAWGLRKSGYATDPNYPGKLIDIINRYDLLKLDVLTLGQIGL